MRTDISRNTFRPDKNYSSVRRQQGRVDLDADWNEQVDIFHHDARLRFIDSLGPVGAPAGDAGFQISPSGDSSDLLVSPGRFYIDGILVRNDSEFNVSTQPDLPGVALPAADGNYLAYLKVHERAVTALEDPTIRESALGGPDTTTRTKVMRQIHLTTVASTDLDSRTIPPEWNTIVSRNAGRLSARTQADDAQSDPCSVGARGGYTGLDNLLYRVEIHGGGIAGSATYKWSRDNASLVTEWLEQDGDTLTLRNIGNDNVLNFAPGQWIEISDDGQELEGIPGTLAQILRVEGRRITINPDNIQHYPGSTGTLDITEFSRGVRKVRRWDMVDIVAPATIPDGGAGEVWVPLENGIEVKFDDLASGRDFRTGDYWMIPARADNNNIEWACDNDGNIEHDPHGTYFHYARLAFVNVTGGTWTTVADTREIFPGLTDEQLAYVGGDGQLSVPGAILDRPLEVRVTRGATPVPDAQVRFTVTSGTGTIEDAPGGTSGTTLDIKADADGIARAYWTLADAVAGQSVRAVLLDENDAETALYVVFGAGSGVASGIQYTPISTDSSVAGTTNVQEALDALADNKVNRSGDTMTGNLTVNADLEVTGNMTIRGDVIARDATQQAGDILLGDDDVDRVIIHGTVQSQHTSGALEIEAPVHTRTTDPTKSPLRVDGPSTGGSPRLYRLPLDVDHTNASATTLNDYQLLLTVDTATPISAGRMKSDGGDILFENEDGSGLFYWVESGMNTATTRIWVRVPVITAAANRTIYMLYGNSNAVSQSSSADTFVREISGQQLAYNFDEGSGTTAIDYSPNGFDGTITGATYTTGISGQALDFDGTTNRVSTPITLPAIGTGDASVSLWYQPRQITGDHRVLIVDQTIQNFQVDISPNSEIAFWTGASSTTSPAFPFTLNTWYHIVTVRESGQTTIYVNGAVIHSAANTGNVQASTFFDIGYRTLDGAHPVDGLIDEPRVLHRAMTTDEVADEYNNAGYLSLANSGVEMIRRVTNIEPVITPSAEEANPLSESPILFAQETSGNIGIGTDDPTEKLTVDGIIETKTGGIKFPDGTIQTTAGGPGGAGGDSLALGTIMAWHKSLEGTPEIPEGWVECNGQVLSDVDSPYDGLVIPNLNGERRFLRGGAASGDFEEDQFQGHRHAQQQTLSSLPGDNAHAMPGGSAWGHNNSVIQQPITDGTNGPVRFGSETRPVNMSVVWIMKIKKVDGQSGLWEVGNEGIRYDDGKVSVGTAVADEQLTVSGAISLEEKILEPDTTDDFGKLYVRENDLSHLSLNGTDQYVAMPSFGNSAVGDFSMSLWFRVRKAKPAPNVRHYMLDMRGDGVSGADAPVMIVDDGPNGTALIHHAIGWPSGGSSNFNIDVGNIMDEWHHTAFVREGLVLRAYLDGRLLSDNPLFAGPTKNDGLNWNKAWRLGTHDNQTAGGDNWFNGDLDDLGLWTRALSHDEIATLHNGGRGSDVPTGFASSLLAFYPMSQSATPGQLDDVSGNNFHGTIQNGGAIIPERVGSLYFKDGFGNVTSLAGGGDSYRTGGSGNQVPLGTIMAWHKSFTNTPAIPDGWAECNGQTLDDPTSPYHGQILPDLNNPRETWNSKGSFLRGDLTSGDFEDDAFQGHGHNLQIHSQISNPSGPPYYLRDIGGGQFTNSGSGSVTDPATRNHGTVRYGDETRPANMSVVWIMKIRETDRDRGLWREQGQDIYFDDGLVGVGAKTANAKLHVSANGLEEAPLRVDANVSLQGIQGRQYRQAIDLENTDTNDLADESVLITLDTATLVSQGKMRFDGADMLFVDTDGKTLLPHLIESGINTATTIVRVRVPFITAGESRVIFVQYGKSDASSSETGLAIAADRELSGLALAWNFDEGSGGGVADTSGGGKAGNSSGTWTTGYRGQAITFSGAQGVSSVAAHNWGFSSEGTVSAWIKTSSVPSGAGTIVSIQHGVFDDELLFTVHPDGLLRIYNHNTSSVFTYRTSTSNVLTGAWVHVVGVLEGGVDGTAYRVYVNGVREEGAIAIAGSPTPISDATPRTITVGARPNNANYFTGDIDMVRVYNRPLSDAEVADMYALESLVTPNLPGREFLHSPPAVQPAATFAPEEPNPVSGSPVLFAQNLTGNIGVGTDEPEAKLHIAGEAGVDGIMFPDGTLQTTAGQGGGGGDSTPLGTIIAWHKSLNGTPAIPEGWVECNGQVLSDGDSPFDGQVIPNLNGDGRFLRGGGISGTLQEDAFQGHRHANAYGNHQDNTSAGGAALIDPPALGSGSGNVLDPITDQTNGTPRTADETRPVNMSVVWIMKVKQVGGQSGLWTPASEGIHYDEGKVSVGTKTADEQLTVSGAISLEEKILEPDTTDDFGKIYVRENDLSHLTLNGTDQYVSMPALGDGSVADFTISSWFRLRKPNLGGPGNHGYFLDLRGDGSEISRSIVLRLKSLQVGDSSLDHFVEWPSGNNSNFNLNTGNVTGEWHHTSMVRELGTLRVYLDGRLLSDEPYDSAAKADPLDWNHTWRVGTYASATTNDFFFNGDLDDLGLWNRALSEDEIAALHNGGRGSDVPTGFASSLLAFYPMSQSATAGQLDDISGNNFHGTIQNGGSIVPEKAGSLYFKDGFGNVTALAGGGDSYRTGGSGNQVPVGTIMAWHKSLANTPAIPDGWVECNGQTLDDPTSPYHGDVIPDLNNPKEAWNTKGSFLRGDTTSGDFEDDAFQGHIHNTGGIPNSIGDITSPTGPSTPAWFGTATKPSGDPLTGSNGSPRFGDETSPVNMSVVWIMKVRETDRDRGLWREQGEDIYFDDGKVGVGAKSANATLHVSAEDHFDTPLRVDGQVTIQGVQGRLFRAPITLDHTANAQAFANQQILITLDTTGLISSGKMRADGADIAFTDEDGKTLLPFFVETSTVDTIDTRIWVRIPYLAANATRVIFMQYGRADLVSGLSSASATFSREISGLTAAYLMDEGSGSVLNDASGNGNHGAINGPTWVAGHYGNALDFNSTNHHVLMNPFNGFPDGDFTISFWSFRASITPTGAPFSYATTTFANQILITEYPPGSIQIANVGTSAFSQTPPLNQWNLTTITWRKSDGQLKVYVNGQESDSLTHQAGANNPVNGALVLGKDQDSVGGSFENDFFAGLLDDVRIYDRVLSANEIADTFALRGYVTPDYAGHELLFLHRDDLPVITFAAEEPNPVSGSPILFAQNLTGNIGVGTDDPQGKLHIAGTAGVDGIVFPDGSTQYTATKSGGDSTPIGTIIAWHKSLGGTPAIPDGWVECNGQVLDDIASAYHGQGIPDLNGDSRFLRGSGVSGTLQEDAFQGHWHDTSPATVYSSSSATIDRNGPATSSSFNLQVTDPITDGVNGIPRTADETRPVNMSVVWIMKVKQVGDLAWEPVPGGIAYSGGDVGIGTTAPNSKLTIDGALALSDSNATPSETLGFGKLYARENAIRHLVFDGVADYISLPSLNQSQVTDFTASIWFRLDEFSPAGYATLMDFRGDGTKNQGLLMRLVDDGSGQVLIGHTLDKDTIQGPRFRVNGGDLVGEWHHTVLVREGSVLRAFLDGVLLSDNPTDNVPPDGSAEDFTRAGRLGTSGDAGPGHVDWFKGSLSQAAVWTRDLSASEIAAMHAAGREIDLTENYGTNLVGYWPVDAVDAGTTLNDHSGTALHGTLQAAASFASESSGSLFFKDGQGTTTPLAGTGFPLSVGSTGREVPLGTIMAWHKSLTGTPSMPPGWVECNGQILSDGESPYDTQTMPNLNGDPAGADSPDVADKKPMFLRGGLTSGMGQDDAFQGHWHPFGAVASGAPINFTAGVTFATGPEIGIFDNGTNGIGAVDPTADLTNGTPRTTDETRPVNMSVVWIMKIKHVGNGAWEPVSSGLSFMGNRVGIGTTTPGFELDVTGTIQCVNLLQTSDARRKTDVETVESALDLVDKLRGVRFKWNPEAVATTSPANTPQLGLIAQEVEAVLPEVVTTGQDGYKAIEYGKLVAVLIEAIKELKRDA